MRIRLLAAALLMSCLSIGSALGEEVYQTPDAFIGQAFGGDPPPPEVLWIDDGVRQALGAVLQNPPAMLRERYWRKGPRTAWILERIGKHEPITTGVVVHDGRLETIKVLVYRESRGWEVRQSFFTDQFTGATLNDGRNGLDRRIDGISGATLSVQALTDISEMALVLHDAVVRSGS